MAGNKNSGRKRIDVETRFWNKVDKTATCWLWKARVNNHGYGLFRISYPYRREVYAHRYSWELESGPIGESWVLHKCDVPNCVNPGHLFLGDPEINMRDRSLKRRGNMDKLTPEQVEIAKQLCQGHQSYGMTKHLAEKFGVSRWTIQRAAKGETFKPL